MTVPQRYPFLTALVLLGVIAGGAILVARARVEARNNTVEVILDAEAWRELALREGRPPAEILAGLRARGATSVSIYEATLRRLREHGLAHYVGGAELQAARRGLAPSPAWAKGLGQPARPEAVYIVVDPALTAWVGTGFRGILGARRVRRLGSVIEVIGTKEDLEEIGLGFLPAEAAAYRDAGFHLVLRARNYRGLTPEGLAFKFRRYAALGSGQTMVFESAEVIGYVRLLDRAADHMRRLQTRFGRIEVFSARRRQRGEDALTAGLRPAVIRLFSVTPEELTVLPPPAAASKYVRSAKERNIRLLYLRPLMSTGAGQDALKVNEDFVQSVVRRLGSLGFRAGRAAPLQPVHLPIPLLMLTIVGGLAMGAILLAELAQATGRRAREWQLLVLVAVGAVLTLLLWAAGPPFTVWRKVVALGVAIAGATLAVVIPLRMTDRSGADRNGRGDATFRAVWTLVEATLISCGAAILVAAILTNWSFMMAVDIFMGVKLAHLLPLLIVAALLISKHSLARPGLVARDVWTWLERPLRMQYAVIGIVALAGAFVLLGRSGNFGLPLLGVEERMRVVLEELLVARPRTKEFLIGHPALMLAGACAALGLRRWMVALAAVGAVGQAGIINTFSHIHSPLELALQRSLNALVLGFLLGLIAVLVLHWTVRRWRVAPARPRATAIPSATSRPAT